MTRALHEQDETWGQATLQPGDEDERLPWLDTEEDSAETQGGLATSRLLLAGLVSLTAVGILIALAWFVVGAADNEPPADGSLIEAPDEPYKTRPDNAERKEFPGTGDTSFAVGEGQTREGQLADTAPPATVVQPEVAAPSLATTLNEGPRDPEPAAGTLVQVGAYPSRTEAQDAWARLMRQTEVLNGVRNRIVEARVDIGTVHRLQAVTGSNAEARSLCARLKNDGLACFVK